jgi:RHS repeat-associated protein
VVFTLPAGDYRFRADYDGVQFWSGLVNHCTIPGCLEALVEIPGRAGAVSVTIDYIYDPLQRLVAADYSTGEFFHYSYDAVGNRLTQDTLAGTNIYAYDIANRLVAVDAVPYTWDDNGNLLDDGLREYAYDHANRLTAVSDQLSAFSFAYSGLGDRLRQTVDGLATEYTLDIETGLTQLLQDGTNRYLYGLGRIGEEQPARWRYHLADALGSSRHLTNASATITLSRSYKPLGGLFASSGSDDSVFDFVGEQRDATGLTFLRARYYASAQGLFISRDTWDLNPEQPISQNHWVYVNQNPVQYTDHSGRYVDSSQCSTYANGEEEHICRLQEYYSQRMTAREAPPVPVTWNPRVNLGLVKEITRNRFKAQYELPDRYGPNLCGQLALAMILETHTDVDLADIIASKVNSERCWTDTNGDGERQSSEEYKCGWPLATDGPTLQRILEDVAPGWSSSYQACLSNPDSPGYCGGSGEVAKKMKQSMKAGRFLIPLTSLSTSTGELVKEGGVGHWVVVTGFSQPWYPVTDSSGWPNFGNWVRVNNPFNNAEEYYPWTHFASSMLSLSGWYRGWVEVWPDPWLAEKLDY